MINKFKLMSLAILGTLLGFIFSKVLIPEITFFKYFAIEVVITILHTLYTKTKYQTNNI